MERWSEEPPNRKLGEEYTERLKYLNKYISLDHFVWCTLINEMTLPVKQIQICNLCIVAGFINTVVRKIRFHAYLLLFKPLLIIYWICWRIYRKGRSISAIQNVCNNHLKFAAFCWWKNVLPSLQWIVLFWTIMQNQWAIKQIKK